VRLHFAYEPEAWALYRRVVHGLQRRGYSEAGKAGRSLLNRLERNTRHLAVALAREVEAGQLDEAVAVLARRGLGVELNRSELAFILDRITLSVRVPETLRSDPLPAVAALQLLHRYTVALNDMFHAAATVFENTFEIQLELVEVHGRSAVTRSVPPISDRGVRAYAQLLELVPEVWPWMADLMVAEESAPRGDVRRTERAMETRDPLQAALREVRSR
jgi:hypothetical protein